MGVKVKKEITGFKVIKRIPYDEKKSIKVGEVFDHFGGLVSGVQGISFTNKEYFEPVTVQHVEFDQDTHNTFIARIISHQMRKVPGYNSLKTFAYYVKDGYTKDYIPVMVDADIASHYDGSFYYISVDARPDLIPAPTIDQMRFFFRKVYNMSYVVERSVNANTRWCYDVLCLKTNEWLITNDNMLATYEQAEHSAIAAMMRLVLANLNNETSSVDPQKREQVV